MKVANEELQPTQCAASPYLHDLNQYQVAINTLGYLLFVNPLVGRIVEPHTLTLTYVFHYTSRLEKESRPDCGDR